MGTNKSDTISSYACSFKHTNNKALKDTITYYTNMCEYLKNPVLFAWNEIKDLNVKKALPVIEQLIHATKENPHPKFKDFDKKFYKCPCYLRRAAISNVIGHIRSHYTHLEKWKNSNKSTKMPSIPTFRRELPILSLIHI